MPGVSSLMEVVEAILDHLEQGAKAESFREPIQRGSASGMVCLEPDPDEPRTLLLVVRLEIMPIPVEGREELYRALLELNDSFRGRASFGVGPDGVVSLTAGRPVVDLDPTEVLDLILWTSEQADLHDDRLKAAFG